MEQAVRRLFGRYESFFGRALAGDVDRDEAARLYASEFIAASPAGVMAGRNDEAFLQAMARGYNHYRAIGTREMRVRRVDLSRIDDRHCVAHVAWTATYARDDLPATAIDFDVHHFVQLREGEARVFGWVAGDEQALLKRRGIV